MLLKINNVEIFVSMPSNQIKYSYDIKLFKIGIVTWFCSDRGIEASRGKSRDGCHSRPREGYGPDLVSLY